MEQGVIVLVRHCYVKSDRMFVLPLQLDSFVPVRDIDIEDYANLDI